MNSSIPTLSICIPTYNRANALAKTLDSIISCSIFKETDLIEICISDNHSTDGTQTMCTELLNKFPTKIKYTIQPETSTADLNIENSIKPSTGKFIKLLNDNFILINGAIEYILKLIEITYNSKPVIFFSNRPHNKPSIESSNNLNDFVRTASFVSGWLSSLSIWRDHYLDLNDFSRNHDSQLVTTDVFFRTISKYKNYIAVNQFLINPTNVEKKGGYSIAKVFGINYIELLLERLKSNEITMETFLIEKKKVFYEHIIPMSFTEDHSFTNEAFMKNMQHYFYEEYFQNEIDNAIKLHFHNIVNKNNRTCS